MCCPILMCLVGVEGLGQRLWEHLAGELAAEKQAVAAGGQELARLEQTLRK